MVDIDTFRTTIDQGILKPSRYRVRFPVPPAMSSLSYYQELYNTDRYLEFYSDSVDFVGKGIATHNITRYGYGPTEKKPIAPTFQDAMITFYNDSQAMNYAFFEAWMGITINSNMSEGISGGDVNSQPYEVYYKDDYAVDGMVTLIDNNGNDVATWRYRQMYPVDTPNMKLGWSIIQDVQRLTVIFTYMDKYVDVSQGGTFIDQTGQYPQVPTPTPPANG